MHTSKILIKITVMAGHYDTNTQLGKMLMNLGFTNKLVSVNLGADLKLNIELAKKMHSLIGDDNNLSLTHLKTLKTVVLQRAFIIHDELGHRATLLYLLQGVRNKKQKEEWALIKSQVEDLFKK